ncbi:hypothetical protein BGX30_010406 [Mortierella sp. GBA39]|nr:hypothetical protein BGX30_010406 [Mortierella sp. GBA39]
MSAVHESTWTMLKNFYRRLRALSEMEVLNLGIKSKEMQWLDEHGQERIVVGTKPITQTPQDSSRSDDDGGDAVDGSWTLKDDDPNNRRGDLNELDTSATDASFPGLLSLGDEATGRLGYLTYLGGLIKLRDLREHVQATTTETSWTVGRKELELMLDLWPCLRVIELLPSLRTPSVLPAG